jgi:hypothetical protein
MILPYFRKPNWTPSQLKALQPIRFAILRGASFNEAVRVMRDWGVALRRTDALEVARHVKATMDAADLINRLGWDRRPSLARIPVSPRYMDYEFRFDVPVLVRDKRTKEVREYHSVVYSDERLTRREIIEAAVEQALSSPVELAQPFEKIKVEQAVRRGELWE